MPPTIALNLEIRSWTNARLRENPLSIRIAKSPTSWGTSWAITARLVAIPKGERCDERRCNRYTVNKVMHRITEEDQRPFL